MSKNKSGLSWIKKPEPKFIRDFKERVAYKDKPDANTKKKKLDDDLLVEGEEDCPQVVQLRAGDLGEKEYLELKSKQDIENSASSFGKILFKKPQKKTADQPTTSATSVAVCDPSATNGEGAEEKVKRSEIDLIFNLDKEGKEASKEETASDEKQQPKKHLLEEEEEEEKYGLQQPKKRFVDQAATKSEAANIVKKVLAREAKSGNKKLLSFYDQEQEEEENSNESDSD